jgi:hypothetical protein
MAGERPRAEERNGARRGAEAARILGIHRQLLYATMKRYSLDVSDERTRGVGEADAPDAPDAQMEQKAWP